MEEVFHGYFGYDITWFLFMFWHSNIIAIQQLAWDMVVLWKSLARHSNILIKTMIYYMRQDRLSSVMNLCAGEKESIPAYQGVRQILVLCIGREVTRGVHWSCGPSSGSGMA
jgi:hypothetical protein